MKRICKKTTTLGILYLLNSNIELLLNICGENVSSYINNNNAKVSALKVSRFLAFGLLLVNRKETHDTDRTSKLVG